MTCSIDGCTTPAKCRGWCSFHYNRWYRFGDPEHASTSHGSVGDRLKAHGWEEDENGCWNWTGVITPFGYGHMSVGNKQQRVHRLAYKAWVGDIPDGLVVRHKCDNRKCFNPNHLELGTHKDNIQDAIDRGRWRTPKGIQHGMVKLTEQEVLDIRADTCHTRKQLAQVYGVTAASIGNIKAGRTWKHLWEITHKEETDVHT